VDYITPIFTLFVIARQPCFYWL